MSVLQHGYEHQTTDALDRLLGPGFLSREISVSMARPILEYPGVGDAIERRPIDRRLVVIEGELAAVQPYLDAIEHVRRELGS